MITIYQMRNMIKKTIREKRKIIKKIKTKTKKERITTKIKNVSLSDYFKTLILKLQIQNKMILNKICTYLRNF